VTQSAILFICWLSLEKENERVEKSKGCSKACGAVLVYEILNALLDWRHLEGASFCKVCSNNFMSWKYFSEVVAL
jgi:hypothetical protein